MAWKDGRLLGRLIASRRYFLIYICTNRNPPCHSQKHLLSDFDGDGDSLWKFAECGRIFGSEKGDVHALIVNGRFVDCSQ